MTINATSRFFRGLLFMVFCFLGGQEAAICDSSSDENSVEKVLGEAEVPVTSDNIDLINGLRAQNIPITKDNINALSVLNDYNALQTIEAHKLLLTQENLDVVSNIIKNKNDIYTPKRGVNQQVNISDILKEDFQRIVQQQNVDEANKTAQHRVRR